MLLIIFLGLIVKLVSVCDGCDVGTLEVNNFDWKHLDISFSGPEPWYVFLHPSNDIENNLACVVLNYAIPEGNTSLLAAKVFVISAQVHLTLYTNVTNWNGSGYDQVFTTETIWSDRFYVIAIKYEHYFILKHCPFNTNQTYVYVGYRNPKPDNATVMHVRKELQEMHVNVSQLIQYTPDKCQ